MTQDAPAAFFCAEYAVHGSLPVYSGGLGVLAGDILKEASDRAVPLVAVGLMYRHGYFRQRIDASGWQHEYWVDTDPDRVPGALVTGEDGEPVTVTVPLGGDRELVAQVWRVDVGRVPLLLLDADRPENDVADRWITSRLYVGDGDVRLSQYLLLGIGGVRALHALGVEPGVVHLNEGHAAFAMPRAGAHRDRGLTDEAFEAVRRRTVFTTHTPGAGRQRHLPGRPGRRPARRDRRRDGHRRRRPRPPRAHQPGRRAASRSASRSSRCARRGSPTASAPATARSRARCGTGLWPDRAVEDVPIAHVTNGVHIPTWIGDADARAAGPPPRRGMDGPRGRARDLGGGRRDPRRRPVGGPQRPAARADRARARAQRHRAPGRAATRPSTCAPPSTRSTPTC